MKKENRVKIKGMQLFSKLWPLNGFKGTHVKTKTSQDPARNPRKFHEPRENPKVKLIIHWNLAKACDDLQSNHCTSTLHQPETNEIAERAVTEEKKGTTSVPPTSLDEQWWAGSVECSCYSRNVQDLLSDGKTPDERGFGEPFRGPIMLFGAKAEYHLISTKDEARLCQFDEKVLAGFFLGCALYAET